MTELLKPTTLNKVWGATNLVSPPSDSKIDLGWTVEIPTWEDFQWIDNRQDQFIAYLNQHGFPEWDSTTEYRISKSYTMGSDGVVYRCILTNTNHDPATDALSSTYWVKAFDVSDYAYSKSVSDSKYLVKANNLSDITSQSSARSNLGLGTAATQSTGTNAGQVMTVGSFGIGSSSTPYAIPSNDCNAITAAGFYGGTSSTANKPAISGTLFDLIHITDDATNATQIIQDLNATSNIWGRSKVNGVWGAWGRNYNSNAISTAINNLLNSADAPSARTVLGVGSTGTLNGVSFMNTAITNWSDAATARSGLGTVSKAGDTFTGPVAVSGQVSGTTFAFSSTGIVFLTSDGNNNPGWQRDMGTRHVGPNAANSYDLGQTTFGLSYRNVYTLNPVTVTSDARMKTEVQPLNDKEIKASKALAEEIGTYKWLSDVKEFKSESKLCVGMTAQRIIEVMKSFGLDALKYKMVSYSTWDGGDLYTVCNDHLQYFIARGFDARLKDIEEKLNNKTTKKSK